MSRTTKDQVLWRINNACRIGQLDPDPDRFDELQAELWVTHPEARPYMSSGRLHRPKARPDVVREEGWCPERRRVRDACLAAAQEYNACGQVVTEPPAVQHRQGVNAYA
ncbi:hypothetical protein [Nonomuraea dietziae]|uniref:Uncharacterized protein n=1 Tax=Nonomuraea dietziae TaxID=65515 RepID=A0A7W5VLW9_9ACTN|nr:hypothetical protein [Nonomuraea dietziae]MBB3734074.1 hypothetical protein [Nonomuraea dietziae]